MMKKKYILFTLIIIGFLAFLGGFTAQAEEVIKPNLNSTYITEYEDNKQINFTLTSDTKCIVKMYDNGNELAVINCDYTCEGDIYTFSALGGELSKMKFNGTTFEDYEEPIVEEDVEKGKTALYWLETLSYGDLQGFIAAVLALIGTPLLTIVFLVFKYASKNIKIANIANEMKKANIELSQKQEEEIKAMQEKIALALDNLSNNVIDKVVSSNEEEKARIKAEADKMAASMLEVQNSINQANSIDDIVNQVLDEESK